VNKTLKRMSDIIPPITDIAKFSRREMNKAMAQIEEVIVGSIKVVDSLEFVGIRQMTPKEAYESLIGSGNIINVDITKSTFYKTVITFKTARGDILNKKVMLPYLDRYGLLKSSDVQYTLKPVFTDSVLSPHTGGVFIKLYGAKTDISSISNICRVNGRQESLSVIYSDLNNRVAGDSSSNLNKKVTPIAFYILVRYGVLGALKKLHNSKVEVCLKKDYEPVEGDTTIYTDDTLQLMIIIHNNHRLDAVDNIVSSIFYILKAIPGKEIELYEHIRSGSSEDENVFWSIYFGRFFYKGSLTFDKSTISILDHIDKSNNLIDTMSKKDLLTLYIDVEDFTGLMLVILEIFNITILSHKEINSDIRQSKKLNILYYVLNNIIMGINLAFLELSKREKVRTEISTKEIDKVLSDLLTEKLGFKITKSTKKNLSVQLVNNCTDLTLNHLLIAEDQNRGDGVHVNTDNSFPASLRIITPTHFVIGCMHHIGKKAPTPLPHLSPLSKVDANNQFIIAASVLDDITKTYKRMHDSNGIVYKELPVDSLDDMAVDVD